eukprot:m.118573 g.118573  ORF g.118573 m.118573 type:complete len:64 (-) comp21737_c0_seq1:3942-4133(-)
MIGYSILHISVIRFRIDISGIVVDRSFVSRIVSVWQNLKITGRVTHCNKHRESQSRHVLQFAR